MDEKYTKAQIQDLSTADPVQDEEDGEWIRNREPSTFSDALGDLVDDLDIAHMFDIDGDFVAVTTEEGFDYLYVNNSNGSHQISYARWHAIVESLDMMHMHPDVWFVPCKDPGWHSDFTSPVRSGE